MEMLRTIVVALVFAGITVCTYYYLNSSQFPWEIINSGENMAQTSENPTENALPAPDGQNTFAQDSPFAPASMGEDELALPPGLDDLPPALETNPAPELSQNDPNANPMVMASDPQPPVLDTDLPALNDGTNTPPAPIQVDHEKQYGSNADLERTQALPAPDDMQNQDILPAPDFDTTPNTDISPARTNIPPSPAPNTGGVTNPLRANSAPASSFPVNQAPVVPPSPAPVVPPSPAPAPPAPVLEETPAPVVPQTPQVQMSLHGEIDSAAIREYLNKATEKIQNGEALEVLRELSKFYGNSRFSAEESSELVEILVLAAREVIYSQKSFRDPPYTIQAGDTLEKIAAEYQIPQEFIILVNGLQPGAPLQPGTQLKVIRGPFHALVYLDRHEMLLTLDGLFAGRFWIGIGNELIQKNSDFSYVGKSVTQNGTTSLPCCDFTKIVGEPGCAESLKIQACTDENAIGKNAPTGTILMSPNDVQSLGAILGPKSELLMRCHSHEQKPSETETAAAPVPAPAPASTPAPAPAYGSSAELPNSLPNTLPDSLPGTGTAPAAAPAEELPLELPATL